MTNDKVTPCEDCGEVYPFGVDVVLPDQQWRVIHGEGAGGVLCPACIARRAEVAGATALLCWADNLHSEQRVVACRMPGGRVDYAVLVPVDSVAEAEAKVERLRADGEPCMNSHCRQDFTCNRDLSCRR